MAGYGGGGGEYGAPGYGRGAGYGGDGDQAGYNAYNQQPQAQHVESPVQGQLPITIFCEANPDFSLTVRGGCPVLAPAKQNDTSQHWIKDGRWGGKVKDEDGFPAFALINKGSGLALRHGKEMNEKVTLHPYDPNSHDEFVLWTQSADLGKGFQCIRPVGDIHLNLDAFQGTHEFGGLKDGNPLILFKWKKHENQKWKTVPVSPTADPAIGSDTHHQQHVYQNSLEYAYQNPESQHLFGGNAQHGSPVQGKPVKVHCEARPDFFLTARSDGVVLAPGDQSDIRQVWIKDCRWGNKVKDEAGFPAFALIHKATQKALKHGQAEFDEMELTSFNPNQLDESILWTESADIGHGYKCIRPVNNFHLNLDASHGDLNHGGVHDGTKLILFKWRKHENQKWKMALL